MRLITWSRLFIGFLIVCGLGVIPLNGGAQDVPEEVQDPPADVETVSRGPADESTEQGLSSISVSKGVCPAVYTPPNGFACHGVNDAAVGTTVDFVLTGPDDTGEEFRFEVAIENLGGGTFGTTVVTDVPPGTYELCESVPDGYEGFVWDASGTNWTYDPCVTFEIGDQVGESEWFCAPCEEWAIFVNMVEKVDELPDTGAGLTASTARGTWVPVLVGGALLSVMAGSHLRSRMNR